jgi:hypothetical protein
VLWRLATLVLGDARRGAAPLREGAPIFLVSADHLFATAARVLAEANRAATHHVTALSWDDFAANERAAARM